MRSNRFRGELTYRPNFGASEVFEQRRLLSGPGLAAMPLPDLSTDQGAVVAMLIVENYEPADPRYNAAVENTAMEAMSAAIHNRLKDPKDFNARGATTLRQIIGAPGQIQGFSYKNSSVVMASNLQAKLNRIFATANTQGTQQIAYRQFITTAETRFNFYVDPFTRQGGTWAWVTAGSPSPGDNFVAIPNGVLAGNQFYTLPASFFK